MTACHGRDSSSLFGALRVLAGPRPVPDPSPSCASWCPLCPSVGPFALPHHDQQLLSAVMIRGAPTWFEESRMM